MTAHQRRPCSVLLPSVLLPGRLLGVPPSNSPVATGPTYVLGRPGQPSTAPTLLITDFDNSGSVTRPTGTDPLANRFAEVDRAFSLVARRGAEHELGMVLHFDTPSSGDVGPVPITHTGIHQLRRGLCIPPDGAGRSVLGPSLRRATDMARQYPDHQATLVVLSDFQLLDTNPSAVLAELAAFPGTVHAVVLGKLPDAYVPTGGSAVTYVGPHDPPGAVAKAVFASLTRHRPGSRAFREHETGKSRRPSRIPQQIHAALSTRRNVSR